VTMRYINWHLHLHYV